MAELKLGTTIGGFTAYHEGNLPAGTDGATGATGVSGFSGTSGYSGFSGAAGTSGFSGTQGASGVSGFSGFSGVNGTSGFSGYSGAVGSTGATGSTGPIGDRYSTTSTTELTIATGIKELFVETGLAYTLTQDIKIAHDLNNHMQGEIQEYVSANGYMNVNVITLVGSGTYDSWTINIDGAVGTPGSTGISGYSGVSGYSGQGGQPGISGFSGISGYSGTDGATGFSGFSGVNGQSGISGFSGYSGINGTDGATGSTGPMGPSTTINATDDTSTTVLYPVFVGAPGSNQTPKVTTTKLEWNASIGSLTVTGSLFATSKSFRIVHPTKEGMTLTYGSLEGPENGVYVRGRLTGSNEIMLPDYWTKLVDVDSISVDLTPIGKHQKLFVQEITIDKITVGNGNTFSKAIDCYFTVYAERCDVDKLQVEI
jgi:hypothetical protein